MNDEIVAFRGVHGEIGVAVVAQSSHMVVIAILRWLFCLLA